MQISLLTVVTFLHVLVSASAESPYMRGGSANIDKDINSRSLAQSECTDTNDVVYKGKKCAWITKKEKNMVKKCNKSSSLGMVYDLCPFTCAKVFSTIIKKKDNEITAFEEVNASLREKIAALEAIPACTTSPTTSPTTSSTTSPTTSPTNSPTTKSPTTSPTKSPTYFEISTCFDKCTIEQTIQTCQNTCLRVYSLAGFDGVGGVPGSGRYECNDDEFAAYPNYCTNLACNIECRNQA